MLRRTDGDLRHPEATAAAASIDMVRQLMIAPASPALRSILSGNDEPGASQHVSRVFNFSPRAFSGHANDVANLSDRRLTHPSCLSHRLIRLHKLARPLRSAPNRPASSIQTP